MYHAVAHFTNQHAIIRKVICRVTENATRQFQAVGARCQAQFRLVTVFVWQVGHIFRVDIRRVSDNQIVLHFRQITEQIGTNRNDVVDQTVFFDVLFGNRQRVGRDIYRVDFRFREGISTGNGDAAATGTHI
ncbi:hypothetical protein BvCmsHHP019_01506 [Escherichia coli]|nr:hypothetical protein BvCmsHHP019_01506 [Escherichia coli]